MTGFGHQPFLVYLRVNDRIHEENHIDSVETLKWTYDDSKHYKICRCGKIFSSAKHDISQSALEGECSVCDYSKTHICTYTEIPEIPASCISKGEKAHYKCELCKKLYIKSGNEYLEIDKMSIGNSLTNAASKFLSS